MLDGYTFSRLDDFVSHAIMTFNPRDTESLASQSSLSTRIPESHTFITTPAIEEHIIHIRERLQKDASRFEYRSFEVLTINRDFFRLHKCPSNSAVQLVIQLAARRYFGHNPVSIEPISHNHFHKGRIDVNLTICPPVAKFCAAAAESTASEDELRKLFFDAARTHASNAMSTSRGHGFDRHFFALRWSVRDDETVPALFTDPIYRSKRSPPQLMTNCIATTMGREGGDVFDHPNGLSITFEAGDPRQVRSIEVL